MTNSTDKTARPAGRRPAAQTQAAPAARRQAAVPARPGPGAVTAPPQAAKAAPKSAAPKKSTPKKKKGLPLIEIIVLVLLIKIGAGAYYILKSPDEGAAEGAPAAVSALKALPNKVFALIGLNSGEGGSDPSAKNPSMEDYIAAAASAVSPSVAQASTPAASLAAAAPASAVAQNAIAAGALMVVGAQSASGDVARTGSPPTPPTSIPLPPGGDDLLSPAAQLPPSPLPTLNVPQTDGGTAASGLAGENVPAPAQLRSREQELAQKEAMLASKEEALKTLELELNRRLEAMETTRADIQTMTQRNEAILAEQKALREQQKKDDEMLRDARIEHLVIAYKGMKAEQAGNLINSMEDDVAVAILSAMPGRNAGLILANVIPEKAARLTKAISEKRIDPNLLLADTPTE
ncbi:hypothetical protein C4J81_08945 [Deltaproteobacteria bacterium Smac51]|nr:hypothetical protein C4J81_08945 [Deltaproteobacteria bacterium Smac51]